MVQPNYKDRYSSAELALDALIPLKVLAPSETRKFTQIILTSILGFLVIGSAGFSIFRFYNNQLNKPLDYIKIEEFNGEKKPIQVKDKKLCFLRRR
ncbi:MAG: hypothetical protein F6K22_36330 [Okeania sp. SIO2F4]|nr:hypothetical protein [Okeania sp. SIO2F4]